MEESTATTTPTLPTTAHMSGTSTLSALHQQHTRQEHRHTHHHWPPIATHNKQAACAIASITSATHLLLLIFA